MCSSRREPINYGVHTRFPWPRRRFRRQDLQAKARGSGSSLHLGLRLDGDRRGISASGETIGGGVGGESRQANHREAELRRRDLRESLRTEMEADEEAQGVGDSGEEGLELRGEEEGEGDKEGVQGENNGAEGDDKAEQGGEEEEERGAREEEEGEHS